MFQYEKRCGKLLTPANHLAALGRPKVENEESWLNLYTLIDLPERPLVLNHPEVLLTQQPGAQHREQYWAERFP